MVPSHSRPHLRAVGASAVTTFHRVSLFSFFKHASHSTSPQPAIQDGYYRTLGRSENEGQSQQLQGFGKISDG